MSAAPLSSVSSFILWTVNATFEWTDGHIWDTEVSESPGARSRLCRLCRSTSAVLKIEGAGESVMVSYSGDLTNVSLVLYICLKADASLKHTSLGPTLTTGPAKV